MSCKLKKESVEPKDHDKASSDQTHQQLLENKGRLSDFQALKRRMKTN